MYSLPSPVPGQCLYMSSHVSGSSLCPPAPPGPLLGTQAHCEGSETRPLSEEREKPFEIKRAKSCRSLEN